MTNTRIGLALAGLVAAVAVGIAVGLFVRSPTSLPRLAIGIDRSSGAVCVGAGGSSDCVEIGVLDLARRTWLPRSSGATNVVLHVDDVAGADTPTCGASEGAGACASWQRAYDNLCSNYWPLRGVPTIKGTRGQTYPAGLSITGGATDNAGPACLGVSQLILDGGGSTISTKGIPVYLRYAPFGISLRDVTLISTGANLVVARGAAMVNLEQGVVLGSAGPAHAQLLAYGGGQIATCPVGTCPANTGLRITGGGFAFAQAIVGGQIQIEGVDVAIENTPQYTGGFVSATNNGSVSFYQTTFSGTNIVGDQFVVAKGATLDVNGQTGRFRVCADTYLPGSRCGRIETGATVSEPGRPTVEGCGAGAEVRGAEPNFGVTLGAGPKSAAGATVEGCVVTLATRSTYPICFVQAADRSIHDPSVAIVPPTAEANGKIRLSWRGEGTDAAGKTIFVSCRN